MAMASQLFQFHGMLTIIKESYCYICIELRKQISTVSKREAKFVCSRSKRDVALEEGGTEDIYGYNITI